MPIKKLTTKYKKSDLSKQFIIDRMIEYHTNAMKFNLDPCAETLIIIFKNDYVRQLGWNEDKIDKFAKDITDFDIVQY